MKRTTLTHLAGVLLVGVVLPMTAQGQAQAPEQDAEQRQAEIDRALQQQAEQAIRELFKDFELQVEEPENPRQRLLEERERLEALQKRIIELRQERQFNPELIEQQRAAQPIVLEAEPYVNPWADRSREEIVSALNHADFAVRESAEASLLTDNTLSRAVLEGLLNNAVSPEQRYRLLRVAEHHVLREMRERDFSLAQGEVDPPADGGNLDRLVQAQAPAAIGYSYEPVTASENPYVDLSGVRVIATMPGFPGHAHLRKDDIIVEIDGRSLSNAHHEQDITAWVRWRIAAHQAGDEIGFTVLREGKALAITLRCAEATALNSMYSTDAFQTAARQAPYERAWQEARQELTANLPKPKALTPAQ